MSTPVLLDSSVLGLVTRSSDTLEVQSCKSWLINLLAVGRFGVYVPQITDYELRRKLIHLRSSQSLDRLASLASTTGYVPLTTEAMRKAAELWASARASGIPTAPDQSIDVDVILAAQALLIDPDGPGIVATTNVKHLSRFVPARHWRDEWS